MNHHPDDLSVEKLRLLDHYCVRFERALKNDVPECIEVVLEEAPESIRSALFQELLALELGCRKLSACPPDSGEYHRRFPQYAAQIDRTFEELGLAVQVSSQSRPLQEVDGYLIQSRLARGGMGVVYQALDQHLGRTVALKMLTTNALDEERLARFQSESRALAKLDHPNILKIHAVGYWHDQPYLVLEYAANGSLANRLETGPLKATEATSLMVTLTRAVAFLHERALVHRDLKPSNILFTEGHTLKIADFGLVRNLVEDAGLTRGDSHLGTPAYMAPEQINADAGEISPATDVFALGVILHHLLTGRVPYQDLPVAEMFSAIAGRRPVPLGQLDTAGISRDLARVCRRCLQKDPIHRYPTADALLADLTRLQQGQAISVLPLFWQRVASRSRELVAAAVVLAVATAMTVDRSGPAPAPGSGFLGSDVIAVLPSSLMDALSTTNDTRLPVSLILLGGESGELALEAPLGLALHDDRYLAVADSLNHRVLIVDLQTGEISRLVGNGDASYAGDGRPATQATLNTPMGMDFDDQGRLYIADRRNHAVRVIDVDGIIQTLTGMDGCRETIEPSSRPYLCHPIDVSALSQADYFVADSFNQRIRYRQQDSVLASVLVQDDSVANEASRQPFKLFPRAVEFIDDRLYFLDAGAGTVSELVSTGEHRIVAEGFANPLALAADAYDHIYLGDSTTHPISRLNIDSGTVESLSAAVLFGDDAYNAHSVDAIAVDSRGRVYFSSRTENSVRVVLPAGDEPQLAMVARTDNNASVTAPSVLTNARLDRAETFSYVGYTYGLLLTDLAARLGLELWLDPAFDPDRPIDMTHYPLTGRDMLAVSCTFMEAACAVQDARLMVAPLSDAGALAEAELLRLPEAEALITNADALPAQWRQALNQAMDFSQFHGNTFVEFLRHLETRTPIRFDIDDSAEGFRNASYKPEGRYTLSDLLVPMMVASEMHFSFESTPDRLLVAFRPQGEH